MSGLIEAIDFPLSSTSHTNTPAPTLTLEAFKKFCDDIMKQYPPEMMSQSIHGWREELDRFAKKAGVYPAKGEMVGAYFGISVIVDKTVPKNEVQLRNGKGEIVLKMFV